jgi:hypothetical protein
MGSSTLATLVLVLVLVLVLALSLALALVRFPTNGPPSQGEVYGGHALLYYSGMYVQRTIWCSEPWCEKAHAGFPAIKTGHQEDWQMLNPSGLVSPFSPLNCAFLRHSPAGQGGPVLAS